MKQPVTTAQLTLIRSAGGRVIHVKSATGGMYPSCRYSPRYGSRVIRYEHTVGNVTCRWCRQNYGLLVPGERST